jgi:hypothetical protein
MAKKHQRALAAACILSGLTIGCHRDDGDGGDAPSAPWDLTNTADATTF